MKIYYLDHSGFAVILQNRLFVFDYANHSPQGGWEQGVIPVSDLGGFDAVYFFVSHSHGDHFLRGIYSFAQYNPNTRYFLSPDVTQNRDVAFTVLPKGRAYKDDFLTVRAFGSTDMGVSYLAEAGGRKLFHAGDLNCWHWQGEWSAEEEQEARDFYEEELDFLAPYAENIHTAFLPVDPRMKDPYDDGARIFAERFRPRHIVPMHCWGKYTVTEAFRQKMTPLNIDVFTYNKRGASTEYHD